MIYLFLCVGALIYVWIGYPFLLLIASVFLNYTSSRASNGGPLPRISIVIAAHNEENNLPERLENIFRGSYPQQLIEVIIASDGSTDETISVCTRLAKQYPTIHALDLQPQQGRALAHNMAIEKCSGDIVVFTDADTRFEADFLQNIVAPFADSRIGFSSGVLVYRNLDGNAVTESVGLYWRFEMLLRRLEDRLGLLAIGSGACCAVRRGLFKNIPPTGDVDFTTPLDVILAGFLCAHADDAIAIDSLPSTPRKEFRARIRMTSKNLHGTIARWGVRGFYHPFYTMVIFSHKIGRWLTPFLLLGIFISSLLTVNLLLSQVLLALQSIFYGLAMIGAVGIRLPLTGSAYSFCLVNIAFFWGVLRALAGNVPRTYKPVGQS